MHHWYMHNSERLHPSLVSIFKPLTYHCHADDLKMTRATDLPLLSAFLSQQVIDPEKVAHLPFQCLHEVHQAVLFSQEYFLIATFFLSCILKSFYFFFFSSCSCSCFSSSSSSFSSQNSGSHCIDEIFMYVMA